MPRGGRRSGRQGAAYAQRTDLMESPERTGPAEAASTGGFQPSAPAYLRPDDIPTLSSPTERPDEPITAGLSIGAGPGPRPLPEPVDKTAIILASLYEATGDDHIRALLAAHTERRP